MRTLLLLLLLITFDINAQMLPTKSKEYIPLLICEVNNYWPEIKLDTHYLAGQIEQETCYSLTHSKCWSTKAELKTKREYGFGLGQITIAYNANGTERFNNLTAARSLNASLRNFTWENRYLPEYQLRTLVLMDLRVYKESRKTTDHYNSMAFMFAAYNGGIGGLLSERAMCRALPDCQNRIWFNNVENTSKKSKKAVSQYSKSFFEINREYVSNILLKRSDKYKTFTRSSTCPS